ncbi:DUF6056 family protein [uncultured Fibrella sp.]|uniref:DUF6056 family protein n=1 Tax=uncultured Fibrella sp. TaxID=1284596 RepID=UPI0035C9D8E6
MNHPLLARLLSFSAYGFFAIAFVPLLALSWFNHPSAADDYCFADTAVHYGFWQAQKYYYDGWTGRYFSNFLVHGSPLVWGWYNGFKLIPALMATALVWASYLFISELLHGLVPVATIRRVAALLTGTLFFLYMLLLPSVVEAFVWMASITVYTVPTALMLYWGAVLLRWYRQPSGTLHSLTGVWASVLVFLIVGCGETHMLLLISLLLAIIMYHLLFHRFIDWRLTGLLVVALVSAWLVFRAPGNAVRMSGGATSGDLVGGLVLSLKWLIRNVPGWFIKTPLLPLAIWWGVIGNTYLYKGGSLPTVFRLPLWYAALVVAGLLLATVLPSFYATQFLTLRAVNVTYAVFLFGFFYLITSQLMAFSAIARVPPSVLPTLTGLWLLSSLFNSQPMKQLYRDLLGGNAATYNREMTARHEYLVTSKPADTLRLAPLTAYPPSLFLEDVRTDPTHWWNRCQSGYYHHKTIIVDTTLRAPFPRL